MGKTRVLKIGVAEELESPKKTKKKKKGKKTEAKEESRSTLYGIKKFIPSKKNSSIKKSKRKKSREGLTRKKKILIFLALFLGVISYFGYTKLYVPYKNIRASVDNIQMHLRDIVADFEDKDLSNLDVNIALIRNEFNSIKMELNNFSFLESFGPTKGYYKNLEVIISVVDKTDLLVANSLPDLKEVFKHTGFKVDIGEVGDLAQAVTTTEEDKGVIALILGDMPRYISFYERIEPAILDIYDEVLKLNPEYIPQVGSINAYEILGKVQKARDTFPQQADQILAFLEEIPALTGSEGTPARYLIIMQNENELRSSGGIYTVYGSMVLENGELVGDIALRDLWYLENYVRSTLGINTGPLDFNPYQEYPEYVSGFGYYINIYGQDRLMNEGCGATSMRAQDSGLYPDLKWGVDIFEDYYHWANMYDKENFPDYDHIVVMNQAFIGNVLSLVQPVEVEGFGQITSENFIDVIKTETDKPELVFDPDRKRIIDDMADVIKEKFYQLESDQLSVLGQILVNSVYARDIAISSTDTNLQDFLDRYNLSGEFEKEFAGDYFHFAEAQNCSLKINRWMRNEVQHNVTIMDDGKVYRDVYIHWMQPQVFQEEWGYMYSRTTQYSYRSWSRLMTPVGSSEFDSNGYEKSGYLNYIPKEYYDETMNKEVYDMIAQFDHRRLSEDDPVAEHDVTVSYQLPDSLNFIENGEYRLLIQKHPGKSWGEKHTININYKDQTYNLELILDRDKIISFKEGEVTVTNYSTDIDWLADIIQDIDN